MGGTFVYWVGGVLHLGATTGSTLRANGERNGYEGGITSGAGMNWIAVPPLRPAKAGLGKRRIFSERCLDPCEPIGSGRHNAGNVGFRLTPSRAWLHRSYHHRRSAPAARAPR